MEDRYKITTRYYRVNELLIVFAQMLGYKGVLEGPPHSLMLAPYYKNKPELNCFVPYNRGGKTIVTIRDQETGKTVTGVAYCSMKDQFNYTIGRETATERAFNQLNG